MRIPERQEWRFEGRRSVGSILQELNINPETVIVICGDTLLTPDDMVEGDVEIEIRPAISGGSAAPPVAPTEADPGWPAAGSARSGEAGR